MLQSVLALEFSSQFLRRSGYGDTIDKSLLSIKPQPATEDSLERYFIYEYHHLESPNSQPERDELFFTLSQYVPDDRT